MWTQKGVQKSILSREISTSYKISEGLNLKSGPKRGGGVITPSVPYFRIYIWLSQWSLHLKLLYDSDFFPSAFWSTINKDVYEIFVASKVFIIISLSIFKLTQKNSFEYAR